MKKILVSLVVLALCAPAMADVAITAADSGSGVLTITVTPSGGAVVRGVALLLGTNSGDGLAQSASVTGLNTNIDYFATNGVGDVTGDTPNGEGTPAADPAGPGVATLPAADLSLCSGYLDASQGGLPGTATFSVQYDGTSDTEVSIALDTLRGGVVGETLGTVTVQATQVVAFNGICLGDGTGDGNINGADVGGLLATFNKTLADNPGEYNPVYDFTGDDAVNGADIGGFLAVFNTVCP